MHNTKINSINTHISCKKKKKSKINAHPVISAQILSISAELVHKRDVSDIIIRSKYVAPTRFEMIRLTWGRINPGNFNYLYIF